MNVLVREKQVAVLEALAAGKSFREAARRGGCTKSTVESLLLRAGAVCKARHNMLIRPQGPKWVDRVERHVFEIVGTSRPDGGSWVLLLALSNRSKVVFDWWIGRVNDPEAFEDFVCEAPIIECMKVQEALGRIHLTWRLKRGGTKGVPQLRAALALNFTYYHFCYVERGTTLAMSLGVVDRPLEMSQLIDQIPTRTKWVVPPPLEMDLLEGARARREVRAIIWSAIRSLDQYDRETILEDVLLEVMDSKKDEM